MLATQTAALIQLGEILKTQHYQFVTITPASHQRVLARSEAGPNSQSTLKLTFPAVHILRDFLGWNKWVDKNRVPEEVFQLLKNSDYLLEKDNLVKSKIRASTLADLLFF